MNNDKAIKPEMPKLKIGFIVDSPLASKYCYELVRRCAGDSRFDVNCLILQNIPISKGVFLRVLELIKNRRVADLISTFTFYIVITLERMLLSGMKQYSDHFFKFDLSALFPHRVEIAPEVSDHAGVYNYSKQDVEKVRSLKIDVLVSFGSLILGGEILGAARRGILLGPHGDSSSDNSGPAGFWEVYFEEDTSEFNIQCLAEKLNSERVIFRGSIGTKYSYLLNQAALYASQSSHLFLLLASLCSHGKFPARNVIFPSYKNSYRYPTFIQSLNYGLKLGTRLISKFSARLFGYQYRWNVAFSRTAWTNLVMSAATVIKNPNGRFLADPFLVSKNGKDYCFVEDYIEAIKKGVISVYQINDNNATRLGEVLSEPFHLSFPFVFEYNDQLYMCPETGEADDIRLYKCLEFPMKWGLSHVLMADVSAVDTIIFQQHGVWWMFTNISPFKDGDYCSALFIFSADHPLSDSWTPHVGNPVIIDANGGRNAGFLIDGNIVYRPGQCQGFDLYGKYFGLNQIKSLTLNSYEEKRVCNVLPKFFKGISGTHHIHSAGNLTVFDFVRKTRRSKR